MAFDGDNATEWSSMPITPALTEWIATSFSQREFVTAVFIASNFGGDVSAGNGGGQFTLEFFDGANVVNKTVCTMSLPCVWFDDSGRCSTPECGRRILAQIMSAVAVRHVYIG
jgi:hypothetical protein